MYKTGSDLKETPFVIPARADIQPIYRIACLCLLLIAVGFPHAQENRAIPVKVIRPVVAPMYEELPLTGSVTTRRLSRLSPEVAGLVAKLYVDEGYEVNQGDALLELDRDIAVIDRDRAAAQVMEARGQVERSIAAAG